MYHDFWGIQLEYLRTASTNSVVKYDYCICELKTRGFDKHRTGFYGRLVCNGDFDINSVANETYKTLTGPNPHPRTFTRPLRLRAAITVQQQEKHEGEGELP